MTIYRVGGIDADAEGHFVFLMERIALALEALVGEMAADRQKDSDALQMLNRKWFGDDDLGDDCTVGEGA